MDEGMRIWYAAGDAFAEKSVTPATVNECDQAAAQVITDAMAADKAEIARLREALRIGVGCAYPVAEELQPRGHNWSEAYLDQWLPVARAALDKTDV